MGYIKGSKIFKIFLFFVWSRKTYIYNRKKLTKYMVSFLFYLLLLIIWKKGPYSGPRFCESWLCSCADYKSVSGIVILDELAYNPACCGYVTDVRLANACLGVDKHIPQVTQALSLSYNRLAILHHTRIICGIKNPLHSVVHSVALFENAQHKNPPFRL